MIVRGMYIKLHCPFCRSLKDKRMVVQSLLKRVQNRFNVSAAEIEELDVHKTIVLGLACVSNSMAHAEDVLQNALHFIEGNSEARVVDFYYV